MASGPETDREPLARFGIATGFPIDHRVMHFTIGGPASQPRSCRARRLNGDRQVSVKVISALVCDVRPFATMVWAPMVPALSLRGILPAQENDPSAAAVARQTLIFGRSGDGSPVTYPTLTVSPGEKPPPETVTDVRAGPNRAPRGRRSAW